MRYDEFKRIVQHDRRFNHFRELFAHEPLQRFVYHEKCILGSLSEARVFYREDTHEEGGIAHTTQVVLDDCYGVFTPFEIKGIWIPLTEGVHYTTLSNYSECPLIRKINGEDHFLFLVHPKSEDVYADLLQHYQDKIFLFSALSLSSPRSLLISLPKATEEGFDPVMVKVSLNQKAHDILRLLSERECALSVANTSIFSRILQTHQDIPLQIMQDTFSFVPKLPIPYDHGVLYRELPPCLRQETSSFPVFAVPLLSLYGQKNSDFFKFLVAANGGNSSELLRKIFNCFINATLPLLLEHQLSIEAHGQNLILILDEQSQFLGLMYRDMGGVNTPILADDHLLPPNLRNPDLSYFAHHIKDAANALEHHFVWRGLFPLTKQLVKHAEDFRYSDLDFDRWYKKCLIMDERFGVLGNWTDKVPGSDEHHTRLPMLAFCRYGYAECLFGELLIQYLKKTLDPKTISSFRTKLFRREQIRDDLYVAPCTLRTFFDEVIYHLLRQPELTLSPRI